MGLGQRLHENLGAVRVELSDAEVAEVRRVAEGADAARGARYPAHLNSVLFADTPALEGWVPPA